MPDEWLTTTQASKILKCCRGTLITYIKAGLIPCVKIGTHIKVRRHALEEFMISCEGKDISDPTNVKLIVEVS